MTVKRRAISPGSWVDPDDAPELTDEFFSTATPMVNNEAVSKEEFKKATRGKPAEASTKTSIAIRIDNDILDAFKKTGRGWQTRINNALRDWLKEHRP